MQIHELKTASISPAPRRVGRGGKRGKTSGRGGKGQTARAGNKRRPEWRDAIKKIPKRRGFGKNRGRTVVSKIPFATVALSALSLRFKDGDTVTVRALLKSGMIRSRKGVARGVKVLGGGALDKKLAFEGCLVSESSRAAILKAGGTIKP